MSWFSFGKTKKQLDRMEDNYRKNYGKVKYIDDEFKDIKIVSDNDAIIPRILDETEQKQENVKRIEKKDKKIR